MDVLRQRILDDLRGSLKGEVRCDDVFLRLYASDASIYEIKPLAVVRPLGAQDVVATVRYAAENQLAIHPRGAGTGLAGESLGGGIVLDFSRFMRRILSADGETVRIQPGVVHAQLNKYLRTQGRQFGPDPSNSSVTTMGSVIAVDSGGSRWLKYGSARRHVRSLQVVLADGEALEVGVEPLSGANFDPLSRRGKLISDLAGLLSREADLIAANQPKTLVNCSGYQLTNVLANGALNLPRMLVGSEGTLAIITEATVDTQPLPRQRGVALLYFDRLELAAKAVLEILAFSPSACDLMDRRHLSLARENTRAFDELIPPETEAALLVEFEGDTLLDVREQLLGLGDRIRRRRRYAFHETHTQDRDEIELYWRLARKTVPTLFRMKGAARPLPFIEDMAVPPQALGEFLVRMQNVLKQHQITASLFGHAGHGQLHIRPFLDLGAPEDIARMSRVAADIYGEVIAVGGTISGEHADGLSRTQFIRQQYGPLVRVFAEVKQIFDPKNTFNPGKIINDDPDLLTRNLRRVTPIADDANGIAAGEPADSVESDAAESTSVGGATAASFAKAAAALVAPPPMRRWIELQTVWTPDEIAQTAKSCNGCGGCRSQQPDVRMCPIFRVAPAEEASPRAKANLIRALVCGQLEPSELQQDTLKEVADLCVHCHMCRVECPAGVDIPRLMVEAKAAYVAENGLSTSDRLLSRVDSLSKWGSLLAPVANRAIQNRTMRWLIEKTIGVARARKLPRFASRSYLRQAARRRLTRPSRGGEHKVLFFADTFVNYHDPQLGRALVEVLQHNRVSVFVHPDQLSSGMPLIAMGAVEAARRIAATNIRLLAEAIRMGYHVVATEPSAVMCLTHEYLGLVDDDDARLVAANSSEACAFIWRLHEAGRLRLDMRPVNATLGYHLPCHVKAIYGDSAGENLLRLVPGVVVQRVGGGCSGMAGVYGLKRENFRTSLRAGRGLTTGLRDPLIQTGVTECSACKIQMEQGSNKPTFHPLKILALAYNLMPEVEQQLSVGGGRWVTT